MIKFRSGQFSSNVNGLITQMIEIIDREAICFAQSIFGDELLTFVRRHQRNLYTGCILHQINDLLAFFGRGQAYL